MVDQYNYFYSAGRTASKTTYTFTLWGDTTCTENVMYSLYKEYPTDEYMFFNAQGVLDLNVSYPSSESRPIYLALAAQTFPDTGELNITYRGSNIRVLNSQYETDVLTYLDDIHSLLNGQVHDISNLFPELHNILYVLQTSDGFLNLINGKMTAYFESIMDDSEPDPELTAWAGQASEFESKNDVLHDLEESLEGTIEDFEFPTAADQTAVNNVIGYFFNNELVIALTLSAMALMIVFLIL